ncbi:MAG: serine hydrolase [Bacteroidota bacterium]
MKTLILSLLLFLSYVLHAQQPYFPPLATNSPWETTSLDTLGWCPDKVDSLYSFLQQQNTKAFLVLKDGKIVLEKYFGTFTKDSNWYWASAGKSLTALLVGKAQEEGFLSIGDTSSKYLGPGWTNCTPQQEQRITIRHQLTMTSGLDDGVTDNHCTSAPCLTFKANAGTRWAYHNAPYTLLDSVLYKATGQTLNAYTLAKVRLKTGMNGVWFKSDYDNVFASTPRSMARYGLLAQNNFVWNTDTLIHDTAYVRQMTNTSQPYNLSYGYLWWLNGKTSYMFPSSQLVVPGSYSSNAPADMFAAIGKNGQIVSISKSTGLVVVRMGDAPTNLGEVPFALCDSIWSNLNKVMCKTTGLGTFQLTTPKIRVYPNPAHDLLFIELSSNEPFSASIFNMLGAEVLSGHNNLDISNLPEGIYLLQINTATHTYTRKWIKN